MWNKTLDPTSPDFKYPEAVVLTSSDGTEDNHAIDPELLHDPTFGRCIGDYMSRPYQKWTITAVQDAGGYLGSPYYKIVIA